MISRLNKARRFLGFSTNPAGAISCCCNCCCFCCLGPTTTTGSARIRINSSNRAGPPAFTHFRSLHCSSWSLAAKDDNKEEKGGGGQATTINTQLQWPSPDEVILEATKKLEELAESRKKISMTPEEALYDGTRHNFRAYSREFEKSYADINRRLILAQLRAALPFGRKGPLSPEAMKWMEVRKIRREFRKAYARFIPSTFSFSGFNEDRLKKFVNDFNNKQTTTDFMFLSAEKDAFDTQSAFFLPIFAIFMLVAAFSELMRRLAVTKVSAEHAHLFDRPGISMADFAQDFLTTGKVRSVHFYKGRDAVAELEPDANIKEGQTFDELAGVRIELASQLRRDPKGFCIWLEAEQNQAGIIPRDYIPVTVQNGPGNYFRALSLLMMLCGFLRYKLWVRKTRRLFIIVPRRRNGANIIDIH